MALLAVAATIVVALLPSQSGSPTAPSLGPADASAAEVAAWIAKGLGSIHSLQGELVWQSNLPLGFDWTSARVSFTLSANGDYRSDAMATGAARRTGATYRKLAVYDAATREYREIVWKTNERITGVDVQNIDQNTPVNLAIGPYAGTSLQADFAPEQMHTYAAVLRSALTSTYPAIRPHPVSFLGRPSWRIVTHFRSIATCTAIVDRVTGLLLDYRTSLKLTGRVWTTELRLIDLRINPPLSPGTFQLSLPAVLRGTGAGQGRVDRINMTLPRQPVASPQTAAAQLGQTLLLPAALPSGFRLAEIDLEPPLTPGPKSSQADNGLVRTVTWPHGAVWGVMLTYERGLQRVIVNLYSLRAQGKWGQVPLPGLKRVTLSSGALAGQKAVIVSPGGNVLQGLSLYVRGAGLGVVLRGDLTASEFVAAANSLEPCAQ
jgi:hypothetical protein